MRKWRMLIAIFDVNREHWTITTAMTTNYFRMARPVWMNQKCENARMATTTTTRCLFYFNFTYFAWNRSFIENFRYHLPVRARSIHWKHIFCAVKFFHFYYYISHIHFCPYLDVTRSGEPNVVHSIDDTPIASSYCPTKWFPSSATATAPVTPIHIWNLSKCVECSRDKTCYRLNETDNHLCRCGHYIFILRLV